MATKTPAGKLAPCACSAFEFGTWKGDDAEDFESYTSGCKEMTKRKFAQGHDAKLAGFLVRAELNGEEISRTEGGMRLTYAGAIDAASKISEALAAKVEGQLTAAKNRAAKKKAAANRKASKALSAERKLAEVAGVVPAPTTRQARIKVGRWEYDATIDIATGEATHTRKLGGTRTVALGEYKEL